MSCPRGGKNLSERQISMLKRMVGNHERVGIPICSCDVQRVFEEGIRGPSASGYSKANPSANPLDDKDIEILDLRRQLAEANGLSVSREKEAMARRCVSQLLGAHMIKSMEFQQDTVEGEPQDGYRTHKPTPYSTLTVRLRAIKEGNEES
jgi:hypothetical protein